MGKVTVEVRTYTERGVRNQPGKVECSRAAEVSRLY